MSRTFGLMLGFGIGCTGLVLAPTAAAYEYGPVYATCSDANDAGVYDIPEDDPAYWPDGDRDGDGYACESQN
jgi:hypothetical protein